MDHIKNDHLCKPHVVGTAFLFFAVLNCIMDLLLFVEIFCKNCKVDRIKNLYLKVGKMKYLIMVSCFLFHSLIAETQVTRSQVLKVVEQIEEFVIQAQKKSHVPGLAIGIVFQDEVLYLKGFGVREEGKLDPVDQDTVFQLASLSKPITSTILAAVVSDGQIRWQHPIVELDPSFQLSDPWVSRHLTIADLLSHRSGLFEHAGDLLEDLGYDSKTILHQLRFISRLNPFRATYAYTNFGYSEAAFAVANFYKLPWNVLAREKLFSPLRMHSASYDFKDYQKNKNKAVAHFISDDRALPLYVRDPDAQSPAGGASMSIKDLAKWMQLSLGKGTYRGRQLITDQVLLETQNPYIVSYLDKENDQISFYGLGWGVSYNAYGQKELSHSGAFNLGVRTQVVLVPDLHLGIAVLTNSSPQGLPEALTHMFFDLIHTGHVQENWVGIWNERFKVMAESEIKKYPKPAEYLPHIDLQRYAGSYFNDYYGEIKLLDKGEHLILEIGPKSLQFPLRHYDKDTFIMETIGENSVGETKVVFEFSVAGVPKRVVIDYLNNNGLGVFLPLDSVLTK
jgi:CubicO group peptidase (beta-lactamase class C family)